MGSMSLDHLEMSPACLILRKLSNLFEERMYRDSGQIIFHSVLLFKDRVVFVEMSTVLQENLMLINADFVHFLKSPLCQS